MPVSTVLHEDVARRLGRRHPRWVAARIGPAGPETAVHGLDPSGDVEIGSVSKGLTGLLFVDALHRREVAPTTTLGDVLPLDGAPAGSLTLGSLATHTSGLPRLDAGSDVVAASWRLWQHGTNPYGADLATLLDRARHTRVGRPRSAYSNLGFMLLGHALAAAAGTTYAALVADRLATPLGLRGVSVPATRAELAPTSVIGTARTGREVEPWTGVDLGPAGGIRMTVDDLATLLAALLDGTVPGAAALDPVRSFGGRPNGIGAAWMTLRTPDGDITWHNGGTGGFRSIVTLDRSRGTAVGIVTATNRSVDGPGFDLIKPSA